MTSVDTKKLKLQLIQEEGRKCSMYLDTKGIPTIGVGRNIRDVGLRDSEIDFLLENDISDVTKNLNRFIPWVFNLDEVRLRAVYDMCFNLGIAKLLKFSNMLDALKNEKYEDAASEARNSAWYTQVGKRGEKIALMLQTGEDQ